MSPIVDGLEDDFGDQVKFVRLDFDDAVQGKEARALGVNAHPAFMLIRANGDVQVRFAGEIARTKLAAAIKQLLDDSASPAQSSYSHHPAKRKSNWGGDGCKASISSPIT